jgi:hypothetical protein
MRNETYGSTYSELLRVIRYVRGRWRQKVALRGLAVVAAAGFAIFVFSSYGMDYFRFSPWSVLLFRLLTYATLVVLVWRFLVRPLTRKVSDDRVALYVEEHEPSLQLGFISAVEAGAAAEEGEEAEKRPALSPALVRRLVENALEHCQAIEYGSRIERRGLRQFGGVLLAILAAAVIASLLSPSYLRHGASLIFLPWNTARADSPYTIEVAPGNLAVARGADQKVSARLHGFLAEEVQVAVRVGEQSKWERLPMSPESESGSYSVLLFNLSERTDYFVEADGVRSPVFRFDVLDLPYVKQLDLEYRFPAYTGLSPQLVEDGGDVVALEGTTVNLRVTPTFAVPAGRLLVEGREPVALERGADGIFSGSFKVEKEGFYKIELQGSDGAMHLASPEYTIEVVKDSPPIITVVRPGRDTKVTKVDEQFVEVKAEDDYGLSRLELLYSVNGGPEKKVDLHRSGSEPRKQLTAGHTFFLEELTLADGDFISYYARAMDNGRPGGALTGTTDIYFMEVRPFGKEYRQAEQGMGGGGGMGADNNLSWQQREIVAATFKLIRDRKSYSDKEWGENLATLALMQGRLREQVENLVRRMNNRGIMELDSDFRKIAESLKAAVEEMVPAEEYLGERKPEQALPPEQRALQHLQRAEATFREVQVAFGASGGGGGSQSTAEDLADLFELELDKLHNQYETVERGERQQMDNQIDEALQRLQELARRQQAENERLKRMAMSPQNMGGGGGSQRELIQQTEELARRLERLAREKSMPQMEETARRLKEAADSMRRASSGKPTGSLSEGISALDRLKDARRLLEKNRAVRLDRDLLDIQRRAEQILAAEQKIAEDVRQLGQGGEGNRAEQVQRLMERKDQLASEVGELETDMDKVARESRREQKEASRKLQEGANSIRDNKLKEKILYSKGVVSGRSPEYAQRFEEQIGANIEELSKKIEEARGAIGKSDQNKLAEALEKSRELVREMESLDQRMRDRAEQQAGRRLGRGRTGPEQAEPGKDSQGQEGGEAESGQGPEDRGPGSERGEEGAESQQSQGGQGEGQGQQGGERGRGERRLGKEQGSAGERGEGEQEQGGLSAGQGSTGGPRSMNGLGFANPGGQNFQPGAYTSEDIRQFRREFRERIQDAEELRQELKRQGRSVVDLENIIDRMRAFDSEKVFLNPLGLTELQSAVIDGLKQFEFALRREVEGVGKEKLFLSSSDEVPSGYRKLVEEYYRSLSRKPQ